jgi:hypothetical protein
MNRNTGDPLSTRFIFLDDGLLLQVVLKDADLGGCKEVGFGRVEGETLDDAFSLREGLLRRCFAQRVDNDLGGCLDFVGHRGEVIALWMPCQSADYVLELHCY